ncbi:SCO family protein [Candidatus Venteria ishoeyi]|uniref:SCO family protein n=1 Tax=Candidatus Venteria ishoeyi TaxID=1899563 RepID=UPI0025A5EDD0|nr:SCO family protein [Candidatus Venteria ishoeyi]MDM8545419.1 SCO family protein [Candidatus Venteria ishoeyi]
MRMINKIRTVIVLVTLFLAATAYADNNKETKPAAKTSASPKQADAQEKLQDELASAVLIGADYTPLPAFSLRDHNNQVFDNQRLMGHWSLLFFGYTHCPDVCPTELYRLNTLLETMTQQKAASLPEVVFISLDSKRDKPASLKKYTAYYHPDFVGITGEQSAIDALAHYFEVLYERVYYEGSRLVTLENDEPLPADKAKTYLINHSAWLYVINPKGKLHAVFPSPHEEDVWLSDLLRLIHSK